MTTSLRFESSNLGQTLTKSLERQQQRIVKDEAVSQQIKDIEDDINANLNAEWTENLEEASLKKRYKLDLEVIQSELKHSNTAAVMVRRAALQGLLELEHTQYEEELHRSGKAFYVKRT